MQLAALWGCSDETIRRTFRDEEGVLLLGEPSRRVGRTLKRRYHSMFIPASVADRVHRKLSTRH